MWATRAPQAIKWHALDLNCAKMVERIISKIGQEAADSSLYRIRRKHMAAAVTGSGLEKVLVRERL